MFKNHLDLFTSNGKKIGKFKRTSQYNLAEIELDDFYFNYKKNEFPDLPKSFVVELGAGGFLYWFSKNIPNTHPIPESIIEEISPSIHDAFTKWSI